MAPHPAPGNVTALDEGVKALPEVMVGLTFPAFGHSVDHVSTV